MPRPSSPPAEFRYPSLPWRPIETPKTRSPASGKSSQTGTISSCGKRITSPISCSKVSKSIWKGASKLAVMRIRKGRKSSDLKELTDWHNIVVWKTDHVANFLLKGKQIYLEGRLETRSYEDKEGQKKYFTEVFCDAQSLVLLGGGGGRGDAPSEGSGEYERPVSMPRSAQRPQAASSAQPPEDFNQGITDDDVPF